MNLKGRPPKGQSVAERIRAYALMTGYEVKLEETMAGENLDGLDQLDIYVRALFRAAAMGNSGSQRLIRDSLDGLPTQNIHFNGELKKTRRVIFDRGASSVKEPLENEEISHGKKEGNDQQAPGG